MYQNDYDHPYEGGGGGGNLNSYVENPVHSDLHDHHFMDDSNPDHFHDNAPIKANHSTTSPSNSSQNNYIDFDNDPTISNLPRILMMGPRRGGKTSIQRVVFHKMSPHETLFGFEATHGLERSVVDHTPLCRFTIWDFPGDYYGPEGEVVVGQGHEMIGIEQDDMYDMGMGMNNRMMRQPPVHAANHNQENNHLLQQQQQHQQQQQQQFQNLQQQMNFNIHPNNINPDNNHNTIPNSTPTNNQNTTTNNQEDLEIFSKASALIFVLDAQDEPYDHVLQHFTETVKRAARANPNIAIEVFINKVDGELFLSDEAKYDCRRDVMQQVTDELADAGVIHTSTTMNSGDSTVNGGIGIGGTHNNSPIPVPPISYHLTSIYDHSVFEAFSRVVQKLIPTLQPTLETLLNGLVSTCAMEKAYLFDVASKLYISTDSSPVDMQSVELCSDMIDCVLDVSGIYGGGGGGGSGDDDVNHDDDGDVVEERDYRENGGVGFDGSNVGVGDNDGENRGLVIGGVEEEGNLDEYNNLIDGRHGHQQQQQRDIDDSLNNGHAPGIETSNADGKSRGNVNNTTTASDVSAHAGTDNGAGGHSHDFTNDIGTLDYGNDDNDELVGTLISQHNATGEGALVEEEEENDDDMEKDDEDSAYDSESASVIRLSKGMILYLKEVDTMLALVCLTRSENFRKRNLINYNIGCLKKALRALVKTDN